MIFEINVESYGVESPRSNSGPGGGKRARPTTTTGNHLNQTRARCGQATCPQDKPVGSPSRGPWLDHSSPADAYGLTRFALPNSR